MTHYHFAVIGNPIAHSLSPPIHHAFADSLGLSVTYERILAPLISEDRQGFSTKVENFFTDGGHGLNITVPFKQAAFDMCTTLSTRAKVAQAVNTLYMQNNKLCGDNTDGAGLVNAISALNKEQPENSHAWSLSASKIAIIGAGGACRGVILPLLTAGVAHITIANRTLDKAEKLVTDITHNTHLTHNDLAESYTESLSVCSISELTGHYDIIINATSSSLHGEKLTLNSQLSCHCAYDMVYQKNRLLTPFLDYFHQKGTIVADGFSMLTGQAAVSFEIWTNHLPDLADKKLNTALQAILSTS